MRKGKKTLGARVLSALGTLAVLAVILGLAGLKWWSICGQSDFAESCSRNPDCESFFCLEHELEDGEEVPSPGYCTESCETDADCESGGDGARFSCVVPGERAKADLPPAGKPEKLCMRLAE